MRKTEKVKAIVIRSKVSGEKDRVLKLLTSEGMFINAVAKGAQSLKSKYRASSMLFCVSEFVLTYTGDMAYVSSSEVIKGFWNLQSDVCKMSAASYFCQLASFCETAEENEFEVLYRLLGFCLNEAEVTDEDGILTLCASFALKLCAVMGISPHFDGCVVCGEPSGSYFFSSRHGGLVCPVCYGEGGKNVILSETEAIYLKALMHIDIRKIHTLEYSDIDTQKKLLGTVNEYLCDYFHRKNNSFDMIVSLFNK